MAQTRKTQEKHAPKQARKEGLRKLALAGIGAADYAREELEGLFEKFVERGEKVETEGKSYFRTKRSELRKNLDGFRTDLTNRIEKVAEKVPFKGVRKSSQN